MVVKESVPLETREYKEKAIQYYLEIFPDTLESETPILSWLLPSLIKESIMNNGDDLTVLQHQEFRTCFQPSRILIGVLPAPTRSGYNLITLCYSMWCSKNPVLMAIAIHNVNASYGLVPDLREYTLSVPGSKLVNEAYYCGTKSMRETDKISDLGLKLVKSRVVSVPGLLAAIANIELVKETTIQTGDHVILVGRVVNSSAKKNDDLPLLSIGPDTRGYKVLIKTRSRRLAVVDV